MPFPTTSAHGRVGRLYQQLCPHATATTRTANNVRPAMRAHIVCGGYMVVTSQMMIDHDIGYCRRRLLEMCEDNESGPIWATCSNDYSELERWLEPAQLLISYCSAPFANEPQTAQIQKWLEKGGKWIALHGTAGGVAKRLEPLPGAKNFGEGQRKFVKQSFHDTLGAFFMNHPPIHEFKVKVSNPNHPVTKGVAAEFNATDELYMVQLQGDLKDYTPFLTTEFVAPKAMFTPDGTDHFLMDFDPENYFNDGKTRVIGYERKVGKGKVIYMGLGHTITGSKREPGGFKGVWEEPAYQQLLKNAIAYACE